MDSYGSLLEAFEALNQHKRQDPASLSGEEKTRWKSLRREIEQALFAAPQGSEADTREFLRVPVSLSVRYWTHNELRDRYIPVLGEGGLFVATVDPLPVGTRLDLEIGLAQRGFSFSVRGEVVWVNSGDDPARRGMGIRFADLTWEQKRLIYGLVDDNLRQRLLERRRFARIDARLQVQFVLARGFFELSTQDLSLGGLRVESDDPPPLGEKIRLVLHVPGSQPAVRAVAEVVRHIPASASGPAGFGVRFVDLSGEGREALQRYLQGRIAGEQDAGGPERRRHARLECQVKLRFQAQSSFTTTFSRDLSSGGVFIQTADPPPVGQPVEVSLVHPVTLQWLKLSGRVVRVVEPDPAQPGRVGGVGVAFENLTPAVREALLSFLRECLLHTDELSSLPDEAAAEPKAPDGGGAAPDLPPGDVL
ncbi:MAG: TIGR02266 family protein [Myxococcales bacterium]|nr:TIGR02266 family protein [Myxococcales bacterium]